MGIRPKMKIVLGLNDLQVEDGVITDSRYVCSDDEPVWLYGDTVPLPVEPEIDFDNDHPLMINRKDRAIAIRWNLTRFINGEAAGVKRWDEAWEFNPDNDYGCSNVCGWVIAENMSGCEINYALALLHPEYRQSGYKVMPSQEAYDVLKHRGRADEFDMSEQSHALILVRRYTEEHGGGVASLLRYYRERDDVNKRWHGMNILRQAARKNRLIRWGLNVPGYAWKMDGYIATAMWLFKQAGFDIRARELNLMLYWQWS